MHNFMRFYAFLTDKKQQLYIYTTIIRGCQLFTKKLFYKLTNSAKLVKYKRKFKGDESMKHQEALLSLVKQAGQIMLEAHKIGVDGKVSEKGDAANLVTVYDVRVQEFLIREIKALLPDAYFFAEEKENDPKDLLSEYCFIYIGNVA